MNTKQIVVVGGINVDVCGKAYAALISEDSNPGTVRMSLGGVGRNIAHNLCLLGVRVTMLTALAGDAYEDRIRASCASVGIDVSEALFIPEGRTSTYLAIEGPEGDMALALCDSELSEAITPTYLAAHLDTMNRAAAVVIDTNLTADAIRFIAEHVTAPIFADAVSVTKAEKLRPVLGRLYMLKPNLLEAELLSGRQITDRNTLELAASKLLLTGLKRVCISLGARGVYCAWEDERRLEPCPPTELVNASGGGDAMMAGFLRAFLDDAPIGDAARFALACSSIAVEGKDTINPNLTYSAALQRAESTQT